jgi:hypothetical protein
VKADTSAKQLIFSTVRITNHDSNGETSVGTGFAFNCRGPFDSVAESVLVSNKHVLENAESLELDFLVASADMSGPELGPLMRHPVSGPSAKNVIGHPDPDVDVAVLPLLDIRAQLPKAPFLNHLNWSQLPTEATVDSLDVIEELIFIGYPDGWADEVYGTPITRQAITATPIMLPFENDPVFLVDGSVFEGSSGSPVFIFNRGSWPVRGGGLNIEDRILLVGVISETGLLDTDFPVQVANKPFVRVSQKLDLGFAFNDKAIAETINHYLKSRGLPTRTGLF